MSYNTSSSSKTNTLAVVSLISGIASWLVVPTLGAIVAVITGHMARNQINSSYGAEGGDALAMIGLVLGYLNLAMSCVGIVLAIMIFGGVIGLSGCAILSESVSYIPGSAAIPPLP